MILYDCVKFWSRLIRKNRHSSETVELGHKLWLWGDFPVQKSDLSSVIQMTKIAWIMDLFQPSVVFFLTVAAAQALADERRNQGGVSTVSLQAPISTKAKPGKNRYFSYDCSVFWSWEQFFACSLYLLKTFSMCRSYFQKNQKLDEWKSVVPGHQRPPLVAWEKAILVRVPFQ